jgi:PAS domain S-box-containing protein
VTNAAPVNLLLVDDVVENLTALRAILEPLGENLICVDSGEAALRALLRDDFACILLDVQMPRIDGFETASLIKQRERTKHIPIIFLTAISKEERHVFRGYSVGAVDYVFKPFDPELLRSKVSVFVDLHRKNQEIERQARLLREQELAEERRTSEERYRQLADAMPQIVWTSDRKGRVTYLNRRWFEYTGIVDDDRSEMAWTRAVHPDDLAEVVARRSATLASGEIFEAEFRLGGADGGYRWHLGRAVPIRAAAGAEIELWVGTATDIHDHKRTEQAQQFLIEAGTILGSSLDYPASLRAVAEAAVPAVADWCAVHVLEDKEIRQLATVHAEPQKVLFAEELQRRYPPSASPVPAVVAAGRSQLVSEVSDEQLEQAAVDDLHLDILRQLGLRSYMCVPLLAHDRVLGAITFVTAESARRYDESDLGFAEELGRSAGMAIENARLYAQAEEQARAAEVLATIGDGVFLVDRDGVVRLWNPAAKVITGIAADAAVGSRVADVIPRWEELVPRIPIASGVGGRVARAASMPVELRGNELWLSISGVGFDEGTVFAFRDLTEERALEQMRSDLVATVSHELRTPLAAIYGSALTIRRPEVELDEEMRSHLLRVIEEESVRLKHKVENLLLASHLDSGQLRPTIETCDVRELVASVIESQDTHRPENVQVTFESANELPLVRADANHLREVVANLLDNAIKYSPDGGAVALRLERNGNAVRLLVRDSGLGIPPKEQRRIFEKFYRLDPNMTRGIGGTGLGLYIVRELVQRFDGKVWLESTEGEGSTFFVELPVAEPSHRPRAETAAA